VAIDHLTLPKREELLHITAALFTAHDCFFSASEKIPSHSNARNHLFPKHQTMYSHNPYLRDMAVIHL